MGDEKYKYRAERKKQKDRKNTIIGVLTLVIVILLVILSFKGCSDQKDPQQTSWVIPVEERINV